MTVGSSAIFQLFNDVSTTDLALFKSSLRPHPEDKAKTEKANTAIRKMLFRSVYFIAVQLQRYEPRFTEIARAWQRQAEVAEGVQGCQGNYPFSRFGKFGPLMY